MIETFLILFLLLINIILIIFYNKRKIRGFFIKRSIKEVNLESVDKIFEPIKKDNLNCPNQDMFSQLFCIPHEWGVAGMTSEYESWILACISKKSQNIFEFGTCSGKTTLLFAANSPDSAKITSITLNPEQAKEIIFEEIDNKIASRNIINESKYTNFMFSNYPNFEKKIKVIFQDSKELNIENYINKYDLIFIDGGHSYSCIKNDTEKALKMIKKNGLIFWHDYSIGKQSHKDVYRYLNELNSKYKISHIKYTTLCFLRFN